MSDLEELVRRLKELSKLAGGLAPTIDEAAQSLEQQSAEIASLQAICDARNRQFTRFEEQQAKLLAALKRILCHWR